MVSPQLKLPALKLKPEMSDGDESGEKFHIEGAVDKLWLVQLFRNEA